MDRHDVLSQPELETRLESGLTWLNQRAWPLGGIVFVISVLYLHDYILLEHVPISILSSAFAASLPAVFAMLLFVVIVLVGTMLLPVQVLLTPVTDAGEKLFDLTVWAQAPADALRKRAHLRVVSLWLLGLSVSALVLSGGVWLASLCPSEVARFAIFLGAVALAMPVFGWCVARMPAPGLRWRAVRREFRAQLVWAAFVQQLIMLMAVALASSLTRGDGIAAYARFVACLAFTVFCIDLIQMLGANLIDRLKRHGNPVGVGVMIALGVLAVGGMYGEIGGRLISYPIQMTASGGRTCARFIWAADAPRANLEALSDAGASGSSIPLRILAQADQTYFVRPWKTDTMDVRLVPASNVAGLTACGKP